MLRAAMGEISSGERRAWELLAARKPEHVCARAAVEFDLSTGRYLVPSFGRIFSIDPVKRQILGREPGDTAFLDRATGFLRLSLLWYLVKAAPARPSGMLVNPTSLSGGELFSKGTHVLPLDQLAAVYATRPETFLAAGAALGGRQVAYGDAAAELPALPKVPVTLILWTEDDEFPARADLLFDATCSAHLPIDVLWSVALHAVQVFL